MNYQDIPPEQVPAPHQGDILPVPAPPLMGGIVGPRGGVPDPILDLLFAFRGYPDIQPVNKGVCRL